MGKFNYVNRRVKREFLQFTPDSHDLDRPLLMGIERLNGPEMCYAQTANEQSGIDADLTRDVTSGPQSILVSGSCQA